MREGKMIVTFCGHGHYGACAEDERKILEILDRCVGDTPVEFFLGGYGNFDSFAWSCAKKYKEKHGQAKLVYNALRFDRQAKRSV